MKYNIKSAAVGALFSAIIIIVLSFACSKDKIREDDSPPEKPAENNNIFSEEFRRTGWIDSSRFRAVVHILPYDLCIAYSDDRIREELEVRAYRKLMHDLNQSGSREGAVRIRNLINSHGVILKSNLTCADINIYYFDIVKNNLNSDFKHIESLR